MPLKEFSKEATPSATQAAKATQVAEKKIRLLYVEDEEVNWEVTLLHLKERYFIDRASTAQEAFKLLSSQTYHAILMDIQLAGSDMNGIDITRALRGTYPGNLPPYAVGITRPDTPIIFMTAYSARYSRKDLLGFGGDDLVTKPIDFTHLALCLSRCVLRSVKRPARP